ncbi:MAG: hypothetical protein AAGE96_17700 [Cyanobacteria bacterium P01_G01_bin.19]
MVDVNKSIWKPQFIESINQDVCLSCDRYYEVGGRNALKLRSSDRDHNNNQHQVITLANSEQCKDCGVCTSGYTEFSAQYSFSA